MRGQREVSKKAHTKVLLETVLCVRTARQIRKSRIVDENVYGTALPKKPFSKLFNILKIAKVESLMPDNSSRGMYADESYGIAPDRRVLVGK